MKIIGLSWQEAFEWLLEIQEGVTQDYCTLFNLVHTQAEKIKKLENIMGGGIPRFSCPYTWKELFKFAWIKFMGWRNDG